MRNSQVNLPPSSPHTLFGFLQEVQQANIGVTAMILMSFVEGLHSK